MRAKISLQKSRLGQKGVHCADCGAAENITGDRRLLVFHADLKRRCRRCYEAARMDHKHGHAPRTELDKKVANDLYDFDKLRRDPVTRITLTCATCGIGDSMMRLEVVDGATLCTACAIRKEKGTVEEHANVERAANDRRNRSIRVVCSWRRHSDCIVKEDRFVEGEEHPRRTGYCADGPICHPCGRNKRQFLARKAQQLAKGVRRNRVDQGNKPKPVPDTDDVKHVKLDRARKQDGVSMKKDVTKRSSKRACIRPALYTKTSSNT
ncbi:hypothetical protein BDZ85DRAFT_1177 [Elsinoe ampelina]|uniref:Uncharacterized protein n=1 Tax=Elsinoe ampelina TaxID=302913 RepID=A0A6A6GNE3_9PEZI|nr:hypothetical protein BDZ85DRAFT_1177 [Elsinoe ampelina]